MNAKKTLPLALPALVLPLLALSMRADEVSFHPAEGVTVNKELNFNTTFYVDDLSVVVDGQDMSGMLGEAMDEGLLIDATIDVTDEYVSAEAGKIVSLLRSYNSLSLEAGMESDAEVVDDFAKLEDSAVSFKWDEETGEYVKAFHESTGDDDLLEKLTADMDFLALLPSGEVSEGDTWDVSADDLASIFLPGGMVAAPSGDMEGQEEMAELFEEELTSQLEDAFEDFMIQCKYIGTQDEDGVEVGKIEFKYEGNASIDLSNLIQEAIELQGDEMGIEADITATMDFEFDGEGVLLWNLKAGHTADFEMTGEITVMADVEADIDAMGESHTAEFSAEISGEAEWKMSATGDDEE